jgi:hypothetical protein
MSATYAPVGARVLSGYWGAEYTVLSHNEDGTVTVRWEGEPLGTYQREPWTGTVVSHRTPFEPRADVIMSAGHRSTEG